MKERDKLLKRLQICEFVLVEMNLFLDTHPDNKAALDFYKKYLKMQRDAKNEYVSKYGPITASDYNGEGRWNWIDNPWPWENEVNAEGGR